MKVWMLLAAAAAVMGPAMAPAMAEDGLRDFCADRPGLDTPACTIDKGHLQIEAGLGDWTLDRQPDARTDTILSADMALRYGIGDTTEVRLRWTGYGHARTRDRASGAIDRTSGIGDVTIGIKQNLRSPDGSGFALALLPYATLPTGKDEIGAGDWSAGLIVPLSYALSETITFQLTPELDAAVNGDGHGRHFAYGSAFGLQAKIGEKATIAAELKALRDQDPEQHATQMLAGLSMGFMAQQQTQLDFGANAGLNHNSPDIELSFGVSHRF